jgi:hypothetical protein
MKNILNIILPAFISDLIYEFKQIKGWRKRSYLGNSPQIVKEKVFIKYSIAAAQWVETGTFYGATTDFLAKKFVHVHSIEPSVDLFNLASLRFKGRNVTLHNDVSENILKVLLPELQGDINFWLDGHYSEGNTFKGDKDCPVEDELNAIEANLNNFSKISILIDDVRCFLSKEANFLDYPSIDYLVDWARKNKFSWSIEHDIFIMKNH